MTPRSAAGPILLILSLLAGGTAADPEAAPTTHGTTHSVQVKILAINDFHGNLASARGDDGRPVGGAAVLAAYLRAAGRQMPERTLIVHAGDQVGASPPTSGLLQDEPAISLLNLLANDACRYEARMDPRCNLVGTLGNHEFDEGRSELLRLIRGGNHAGGPYLEREWRGARFPYVCANVLDAATGRPIVPPYVVKRVGGVAVAFIGAVLADTPNVVRPEGIAGLRFVDEAQAINVYVSQVKAQGVHAIVVLLHQGARQPPYEGPTRNDAKPPQGALVGIAARLDADVDVVVSGHTHAFTNARLASRDGGTVLAVQARSAGRAYADIDLVIDGATDQVLQRQAQIVTTYADAGPGLRPLAAAAALVARAAARVGSQVDVPVTTTMDAISRSADAAGESALGDLIADAQRVATGADVALTNPGGIRADLAPGRITWGDLFTVQPFGDTLVTMQLKGRQLRALLEQQWHGQSEPRLLQVAGLRYTWDAARPAGARVVEVSIGAAPLDPDACYRVTVNSYLAAGGDRFGVLLEGTQRTVGAPDVEALAEYLRRRPQPFSARRDGRIRRLH